MAIYTNDPDDIHHHFQALTTHFMTNTFTTPLNKISMLPAVCPQITTICSKADKLLKAMNT